DLHRVRPPVVALRAVRGRAGQPDGRRAGPETGGTGRRGDALTVRLGRSTAGDPLLGRGKPPPGRGHPWIETSTCRSLKNQPLSPKVPSRPLDTWPGISNNFRMRFCTAVRGLTVR